MRPHSSARLLLFAFPYVCRNGACFFPLQAYFVPRFASYIVTRHLIRCASYAAIIARASNLPTYRTDRRLRNLRKKLALNKMLHALFRVPETYRYPIPIKPHNFGHMHHCKFFCVTPINKEHSLVLVLLVK